jgi:hypothetical protein
VKSVEVRGAGEAEIDKPRDSMTQRGVRRLN